MSKVIEGSNTIREIPKLGMLTEIMKEKKAGRRLSQACASYFDGRYELSYSFADDETADYETLRVLVELDEEVPSITELFPYAVFYENEMKELFGVRIEMISLDYQNKFYRITKQTPFLPANAREEAAKRKAEEEAAKQKAEKEAAESLAGAVSGNDAGAAAAPAQELIPDSVTLPNGKVMDLSKLPPERRRAVWEKMKAQKEAK